MKKILLSFVLIAAVLSSAIGQKTPVKNQIVDASAVPAAVVSAFESKFPGATIVKWEKREITPKKKAKIVRYIAVFDLNEIRQRARFAEDGKAQSTSTYYRNKNLDKLPEPIKKFAADKYPGYNLTGAEKEHNETTGKYVYRIRLKKGSTKVVVYVNEAGEEINRTNIDKEVLEGEGIEE